MSEEWPTYDATFLLHKHGKLGLNNKSSTPDKVVDAIADSMDEEPQEGDYEVPEEFRSDSLNRTYPKMKAQMLSPSPETDAERMIKRYAQQNGGIVVKDGESAQDAKDRIEDKKETSKSLLLEDVDSQIQDS